MYITLYGKTFRGIPNFFCVCNFLKICMVSDKMIHTTY